MEALLRMGVNSRGPGGSVLGVGKQWKGDMRRNVTNKEKEQAEVSPAGLQADGVGEGLSVVKDGCPGLSVGHCGRRQGTLEDTVLL